VFNADGPETFDSLQLNREFQKLGLDGFLAAAPDQARPNKRRKVSTHLELLERITGKLFSLLGSQHVTDLAGLSKLTE
jgi:hypothetical protein